VLAGGDEGHVVSRMLLIVAPGYHAVVDYHHALTVAVSYALGGYVAVFIILEVCLRAVVVDQSAVRGIVFAAHLPDGSLVGTILIVDGNGDLYHVVVGCVDSYL